jgi:stage V sporulation protein SpoVS
MIGPQKAPAAGILKVSAQSNPTSVAGALAGVLRERAGAELQAIGAGVTNRAIKAIERNYLETD